MSSSAATQTVNFEHSPEGAENMAKGLQVSQPSKQAREIVLKNCLLPQPLEFLLVSLLSSM